MEIVGITGSIGCGKTTVAEMIRQEGYVVYDMDAWCRKMYSDKNFLKIIKNNFPQSYENNIFNKRKLRKIVFKNKDALKKLEELTHPFLKKKFFKTIHQNKFNPYPIFIDVALLIEMGLFKYCTKIIVVDVDYQTQMLRVMKRDNISETEFHEINQKQICNDVKKLYADFVLKTDKKLNVLKKDVILLLEGL